MGFKRVFNEKVFKFMVFATHSPREARAHKIGRMQKLIEKGLSKKELRKLGFSDVMCEVVSYHTTDSGWTSQVRKDPRPSGYSDE